ncbi:MAG: cytochrome c family protein, partial [Planctomycetales bacterium]|nr:cytochrome c family protein [Planctomycetales bacterium]
RGAHVDAECQRCHTTGFGLPGGFLSARRTPELGSVGCESCHGPSHAHALNPHERTPFPAREQCIRCHDHENSPTFDFSTYWPRIKHGREGTERKATSQERKSGSLLAGERKS